MDEHLEMQYEDQHGATEDEASFDRHWWDEEEEPCCLLYRSFSPIDHEHDCPLFIAAAKERTD